MFYTGEEGSCEKQSCDGGGNRFYKAGNIAPANIFFKRESQPLEKLVNECGNLIVEEVQFFFGVFIAHFLDAFHGGAKNISDGILSIFLFEEKEHLFF